ncbi:MAG: hypothetical protein IJR85_10870 [Synergistaceae bacterium]|nr:hypothetical protein [Synergistaceae bacterium]
MPSDDSLADMDRGKIACLSFHEDIITWLEECAKISSNGRVSGVLEQLAETIGKITTAHIMEGQEIMDTAKEIVSSTENRTGYEPYDIAKGDGKA